LRAERDFSDALVDSLPGAFYLYTPEGKFLRWNRNFERVTGYSGSEIARMHPLDFFLADEQPMLKERIAEVFAKGSSEVEAGFLAKDGSTTPYFFTGMTVTFGGETCLAGVGIDISERRRAEERVHELNADLERRVILRTAELQAKNRELETFTYSVSHDLKAPLRGIDGYSRLLQEDYGDKFDEEGRRFLASVRQASQQMGQLIDDLLAYSQLERRAMTLAPVKPQAVIDALPVGFREELAARGVEFTVDLPDHEVNADINGLSQVLRNLLDNALKFTRGSSPPRIEVGGRIERGRYLLWVRDNGIGFEMKFVDRIFDIFQRLHRAEDYPGTGVGLAIVRKAVERMGGRAWATGELGRGATFFVELPLHP
jgi:PAS domain S-box-containing protein